MHLNFRICTLGDDCDNNESSNGDENKILGQNSAGLQFIIVMCPPIDNQLTLIAVQLPLLLSQLLQQEIIPSEMEVAPHPQNN